MEEEKRKNRKNRKQKKERVLSIMRVTLKEMNAGLYLLISSCN